VWGRVLPTCQDSLRASQLEVFFLCFPWSNGLSVISRSSEVVSPNGWLVNSIWFLLSTGKVAISLYKVVRSVVFAGWKLCCSTVVTVAGQLLPQQGGAIQFCAYPQSCEISSAIHLALLWEVGLSLQSCPQPLFLTPPPLAKFGSLPYPGSLRLVHHSTLSPLSVVDYNSTVYIF
jgi:hypothetical protein